MGRRQDLEKVLFPEVQAVKVACLPVREDFLGGLVSSPVKARWSNFQEGPDNLKDLGNFPVCKANFPADNKAGRQLSLGNGDFWISPAGKNRLRI